MNGQTDQQLLREYVESGSEAAFSEIVRRYIDLVYSVALRLAGNAHLAEDISQKVFVALAHNAGQLAQRPVLSGWLYGTAHNLSANAVRSEVRRRAREQEALAMNELTADSEPQATWASIAPHLDAAMGQLSEADRDAVLMRYFQRKSARDMAQTLGITAEAAQKRVNRAVDRLRILFAQRGIVVGSTCLVFLIGAHAVQAAPVGLGLSVSIAAASGTSISVSKAITTTKILLMTTSQKVLVISAALVALVGGIYQVRQNSLWKTQSHSLKTSKGQPETPRTLVAAADISKSNQVVTQRPATARAKRTSRPSGFLSTELYAFITNQPVKLTFAQVEPYLNVKERDAASLLAAFRTTGDLALLSEALQKYPNDPHVGFEVAIRNDASSAERRAGLDAFKQAAPDNALANYLSARDYFLTGHKAEAVQELNAAASKSEFQDYTLDRAQTDEEVYLSAGYPPGEARMLGNWFLTEAHLSQVREVGQNLVDLSQAYQQAGDSGARETALQMSLDLGRRLDDPSGQSSRWQLIGIRVERAALREMDPDSPIPGTDQLVQNRLDQLATQMSTIQGLAAQADPIWKTLSDQDWGQYLSQVESSGEEAAVRWLVSTHGHN
jgi:RNA polymerase sigma factor (sigma-70 family)